MRLIDGDALYETLCHIWDRTDSEDFEKAVFETIINAPTIESEKKKGKWIDYSDEGYVECPFCHSATNCEDNKDELHYCFSCGAELR